MTRQWYKPAAAFRIPLFAAVGIDHQRFVGEVHATLLLQRGADPTLTDQEGRTAKERSAPDTAPCLALPR